MKDGVVCRCGSPSQPRGTLRRWSTDPTKQKGPLDAMDGWAIECMPAALRCAGLPLFVGGAREWLRSSSAAMTMTRRTMSGVQKEAAQRGAEASRSVRPMASPLPLRRLPSLPLPLVCRLHQWCSDEWRRCEWADRERRLRVRRLIQRFRPPISVRIRPSVQQPSHRTHCHSCT